MSGVIYSRWRRLVAKIFSPVLVALAIVMLIKVDNAEGRLVAMIGIVFFTACGIMPWVDTDTERGQTIAMVLSAMMGLAAGGTAVGSALAGPNWAGVVIGSLGFLFFFGGSVAALIIRHRRRVRR